MTAGGPPPDASSEFLFLPRCAPAPASRGTLDFSKRGGDNVKGSDPGRISKASLSWRENKKVGIPIGAAFHAASPGAASSTARQVRGGIDSVKEWCVGVLERLEQTVPLAAQEMTFGGAIPVGSCLLRPVHVVKCATVTVTPKLMQSTVGCEFTEAWYRDESKECRNDDAGPAPLLASQSCSPTGLCSRLAAAAQNAEIRATVTGIVAAALAPLAMQGGTLSALATNGPALAFCPLPVCPESLGNWAQQLVAPDLSMKGLERGILVATFVQGSLGLLRICLGDVFSGSYTLLLATLGYNARAPGPASNWLKTYVLITFINGTMSSIDLVQQALQQNFPVLLLSLPLSVNLAHFVSLCVPVASFLGAYCGWQHVKMQRKLLMEQYQQQIHYMLQNPPWPPPPLPDQIVRSMLQQSLVAAAAGSSGGPPALPAGMADMQVQGAGASENGQARIRLAAVEEGEEEGSADREYSPLATSR